jgi:hypothetical protein
VACPGGSTSASGSSTCVCAAGYLSTGAGASLSCTRTWLERDKCSAHVTDQDKTGCASLSGGHVLVVWVDLVHRYVSANLVFRSAQRQTFFFI